MKAFVNGVQPAFEVPPIIKDGRTLVPFRAIAEALGADVKWDAETRTVTVSKGDKTVQLPIGSNVALVNGQEISLDVPASIIQGRTLVPARFLANALGAKVDWVPVGQIVVINASPDTTTTK
ncbi:copper amine oxidase N-terminal domain-containing protein [Thermicanus aegyptius]|uniref:copper amine oxidase N-terminal domain-containing protein n=1 Tax=Thermicanus aegyptius TaxID=94009 RepID=UPI00034DACD0|nr:copper amine oxidase N-terminal domain-containing protein [Thermicanus aegyptius]